MTAQQVQTAVPFLMDRTFPPQAAGEFAKMLEASGVVDDFQAWDQLLSWMTGTLWKPENTALANIMKDPDSFADAFLLAAYATAATNKIGVAVSTDAIRRGPAELMQTMLTLASATEGRTTLLIGAGELKQAKPFGYRRAEGLKRLEDTLRIFRLLMECEGPFDYAGHHWNYRRAWVGGARSRLPQIWALGGGPQLRELAAKYADGFNTTIPGAFSTPEAFAAEVKDLKRMLEDNGRDPEKFTFGIWAAGLVHEDSEVVERVLANPIAKYMAAVFGRLNQADWKKEGLEPIFPADWHYALKLLPAEQSDYQVSETVARTSMEHARRSWMSGSPKEVAAQIQPYVDAGATWVSVSDTMPLFLPPEETATAIESTIEVCRLLKQGAG